MALTATAALSSADAVDDGTRHTVQRSVVQGGTDGSGEFGRSATAGPKRFPHLRPRTRPLLVASTRRVIPSSQKQRCRLSQYDTNQEQH